MKEYLLSTNNFGEPKVYSDNEARGLNILRLLLLIQGHNPLFPKMGCNLVQFPYRPHGQTKGTKMKCGWHLTH